jgi:hypothetical protein
MTPGAPRLLVNGAGKFLQVDVKGNGLPLSLRGHLFIRMTLHAVFNRGCERSGGKNQGKNNGKQPGYDLIDSFELRAHHKALPFLYPLSS